MAQGFERAGKFHEISEFYEIDEIFEICEISEISEISDASWPEERRAVAAGGGARGRAARTPGRVAA